MFGFTKDMQTRIRNADAKVRVTSEQYVQADWNGASERKKRALAKRMQAALKKRQKLVNPSNQSTRTDRR